MAKSLPSALLTRIKTDQDLKRLAQHCATRFRDCEAAMTTWRSNRDTYRAQAEDNFAFREKRSVDLNPQKDDMIFSLQNDSLNIVGGFAEYLSARTIDDILGGEDYFTVRPETSERDEELAKGLQKHSEWKLRSSNIEDALRDAITKSYDLGEAVIKVCWRQEEQWFERLAVVLVDKKTGEPLLDADRDYITLDDVKDVEVAAEDGPAVSVQVIAKLPDKDGNPLKLDEKKHEWKEMYVAYTRDTYRNVDATVVDYRDFVAPLTVAKLDDADFVAHRYDMLLSKLAIRYQMKKDLVERLRSASRQAKAELTKPDGERGEMEAVDNTPEAVNDPLIKVAECYPLWMIEERLCRLHVVIDLEKEEVIWAEYCAAITPDGMLPFKAVVGYRIVNRWYGRGMYEALEKAQLFIDRQLNYVGHRNKFVAKPLKGVRKDCLDAMDGSDGFEITPDKTVWLKSDKTLREAIQFLEIPDLDERTWQLMQTMIQIIQLRKGVTSAAQGGVEAVPQSSTATGVEAILNSGNVLSKLPISNIKADLRDALWLAITTIYTHLDRKEAFTYLEGESPEVITIQPEQVRNLRFDVRLTMTKFREREMRENSQAAIGVIQQYMQLPSAMQRASRKFYVQLIRSFGYADAESAIPAPQEDVEAPTTPAPL